MDVRGCRCRRLGTGGDLWSTAEHRVHSVLWRPSRLHRGGGHLHGLVERSERPVRGAVVGRRKPQPLLDVLSGGELGPPRSMAAVWDARRHTRDVAHVASALQVGGLVGRVVRPLLFPGRQRRDHAAPSVSVLGAGALHHGRGPEPRHRPAGAVLDGCLPHGRSPAAHRLQLHPRHHSQVLHRAAVRMPDRRPAVRLFPRRRGPSRRQRVP
mmetsp:Transcript_7305/g.23972  ORF Transcript_7305/g.23972 Transcript_7305/m.23972 type:complete len:211 (-) Transcript_7305:533-1165(-)